MNRLARLARFESIYDNTRKPVRENFRLLFVEFGFSEEDFAAWEIDRRWVT